MWDKSIWVCKSLITIQYMNLNRNTLFLGKRQNDVIRVKEVRIIPNDVSRGNSHDGVRSVKSLNLWPKLGKWTRQYEPVKVTEISFRSRAVHSWVYPSNSVGLKAKRPIPWSNITLNSSVIRILVRSGQESQYILMWNEDWNLVSVESSGT